MRSAKLSHGLGRTVLSMGFSQWQICCFPINVASGEQQLKAEGDPGRQVFTKCWQRPCAKLPSDCSAFEHTFVPTTKEGLISLREERLSVQHSVSWHVHIWLPASAPSLLGKRGWCLTVYSQWGHSAFHKALAFSKPLHIHKPIWFSKQFPALRWADSMSLFDKWVLDT